MQISKHDKEGRLLTAEFHGFYLVAVYVPNSGEGLKRLDYRTKEWDKDFEKYLKELDKKKPVILTGDLNVAHQEIDIYDSNGKQKISGFTPEERRNFTELLENNRFVDTFRHFYPTEKKFSFWSTRGNMRPKGLGWRLDYFVVSQRFVS